MEVDKDKKTKKNQQNKARKNRRAEAEKAQEAKLKEITNNYLNPEYDYSSLNSLSKDEKNYIYNNMDKDKLEEFLNNVFKAHKVEEHIKEYFYSLAAPDIINFTDEIKRIIINQIPLKLDDKKKFKLNDAVKEKAKEDSGYKEMIEYEIGEKITNHKLSSFNKDKEFLTEFREYIPEKALEMKTTKDRKQLLTELIGKTKLEIEKSKAENEKDKLLRHLADKSNKEKEERAALRSDASEEEPLKNPNYKELVNKLYIDEAYTMDPSRLDATLKTKYSIDDSTIREQIRKALYSKAIDNIFKHREGLKQLLNLRGYNPKAYEFLPDELKKKVEDFNIERYKEDVRRKNIKYILPKELPHWEKAMKEYNLNPMLSRGSRVLYRD